MWLKGFGDLVDRTKLFSNRFLGSIKEKNFFLFSQHKLISEIFCPFVHRTFFSFKKERKRLRNKAFGSKIFTDKMQKFFVRILSITLNFVHNLNAEIRKNEKRKNSQKPIDFEKIR